MAAFPFTTPGYTSHDLLEVLGTTNEAASLKRFNGLPGAFEIASYLEGEPARAVFNIVNDDAYLI